MKAQMELFPERTFYPDANSTMRVHYGQVQGYSPKDGVHYSPVTYLDGVMEKYVPGDYEFDVFPKLLDLYELIQSKLSNSKEEDNLLEPIELGYKEMSKDFEREEAAFEWIENTNNFIEI